MICLRSTPDAYESFRSTLDSSLGYPDMERRTLTAIPPLTELHADNAGLVYLAIGDDALPSQALAAIMLSGTFEQVSDAEFQEVFLRFISVSP